MKKMKKEDENQPHMKSLADFSVRTLLSRHALENKAANAVTKPTERSHGVHMHAIFRPCWPVGSCMLMGITAEAKMKAPTHSWHKNTGCATRTTSIFRYLMVHASQRAAHSMVRLPNVSPVIRIPLGIKFKSTFSSGKGSGRMVEPPA
jgi:hypothetical protein